MKGQLKLVSSEQGEMGLCKFGRALIEEWTFFRAVSGEKQEAVEAYKKNIREIPASSTSVHVANPAVGYCVKVGGKIINVKEIPNQGEIGLCKFSDGSEIDEWTLFYGPSDSDHLEFNKALGITTSGN